MYNDEIETNSLEDTIEKGNLDNVVDKFLERNISTEIKDSFLDYSMSVIISRAIPDVRDGLKPAHRRILHTFNEEGITYDKTHKKSATSCGKVLAYHPHGDAAVYDTMVRMAQDFTYRYPLIDGKGGFGSPDGGDAAAARYTEARLAKITNELMRDINKDAVDFIPNYDGEKKEPVVLPSRFPNILVNGNMGIAVGMATNIPPHNLGESIDATVAFIDNPEITTDELMQLIKGPDFPTGGSILGNSGIKKAYETGRGTIIVRSKIDIEEKNGRVRLVIKEIPYQVNYTNIITKIGELVRDKQIEGISDLTDESALEGIKIVIDVKNGYNPNVLLNNLYKHTQLQVSFGINFLMLVNGRPQTLPLTEILYNYVEHQKSVIVRRTRFDLDKNEKRAHIVEGLKIALDHIDEIIKIIKESNEDEEIVKQLNEKYGLTEIQAQAILDMRLRRLSGLERKKIDDELVELAQAIQELKDILASDEKIREIIKQELWEIRGKYSDDRRTIIDMTAIEYIEDESLIPVEDIVITLTNKGYIKRIVTDTYKSQNRGGVGVKGMSTNEEDFVESIVSMTTHDYLMFFTNKGKVYRIKGYEVPLFNRQSKGLPIINILPLETGEFVKVMLKMGNNEETSNVVFCTQNGLVKRTNVREFDNIRTNGKIAISLHENDELLSVKKTNGSNDILIASSNGRMIRFKETEIRVTGRTAAGVRGIDVGNGICVGCEIANSDESVLVVTEKGYGKKTPVADYRMTHRGSKGVKALNITEKNGNIVAFKMLSGQEDIIIVTDAGIMIRISEEQISSTGRVAQGVRLINLREDQKVSTIAKIKKEEENIEETDVSRETSEHENTE